MSLRNSKGPWPLRETPEGALAEGREILAEWDTCVCRQRVHRSGCTVCGSWYIFSFLEQSKS